MGLNNLVCTLSRHICFQFSAKKASKSLMHKMVTAKEAWSDVQRIKEAESMMEGKDNSEINS